MNKNIENTNPIDYAVGIADKCKYLSPEKIDDKKENDKEISIESQEEIARLDRFKKDTELKENLSAFVKKFTWFWSVAIIGLLYLIAFNKCHLSDTIIIALLTETLVLTLGLANIVVTHFFPKKQDESKKTAKEIEEN